MRGFMCVAGLRRFACVSVVVFVVGGVVGVSSVFASGGCEGCVPWWHVMLGARPSVLPAGTGELGVVKEQELVTVPGDVEGGSGETYVILQVEGLLYHEFFSEGKFGLPEPNAVNIEHALERAYGAGAVSVSEEPDVLLGAGAVRYVIRGGAGGLPAIKVSSEGTDVVEASVLNGGVEAKPSGELDFVVSNLGDAVADAQADPVVMRDTLPAGLQAVGYQSVAVESPGVEVREVVKCELQSPGAPQTVTCRFEGSTEENGVVRARVVPPYQKVEVRLQVVVAAGTGSGQQSTVSVSGGGAAAPVLVSRPVQIAKVPGEKVPFGIEDFEVSPEEPGGGLDRQAGSHPFQTTFAISLTEGKAFTGLTGEPEAEPTGLIKDFDAKLPPGFVGNPTPFPRCSLPVFQEQKCPTDTVIGAATLVVDEPAVVGIKTNLISPVFNLEPSVGEPARFGFLPSLETPVFIDSSIRNGGDYGINGESRDIVQDIGFLSAQVTLWGVPGDSRHDVSRGFNCLVPNGFPQAPACASLAQPAPAPLFSLPSSCPGHVLESEAVADSWEEPGRFVHATTSEFQAMPALVGCERLPFEPSISVTPDGSAGSSATGLDVDVHVPQEALLNATGLAQSAVKDMVITLPEGVALNPSDADGLEACPEALIGFQGFGELDPGSDPGVQSPLFPSRLPGSAGSNEPFSPGLNFCSNASKVGTAEIVTPLLPADQHLKGAVYLASQESNPFGTVVAMYIVAEDPTSGVLVIVPGEVHLSPSGQIVAVFEDSPQAPFEDASVHFFGGERAPLATPAYCGVYTATGSFVPWSAQSFDEAALTVGASAKFNITSGPHASACPSGPLAFSPSLTAGAVNNQAGGFSPFTMTMSREDGQQHLHAIELKMPPGLSGKLAGVELCPEPQASQGTCGPNSLIGETTVSVGVGGDPYSVK